MPELTTIQQIAVWILPVLLSITVHEASHAYVAAKCGDTTAKMLGRLSFNPMKHIDLIGTIIIPIAILLLSKFSFVFGWAKPVPINSAMLRRPRWDLALVTAAGPLSNLLMAVGWTGCLKLALLLNPQFSTPALFLLLMARAGIFINLLLAFFNLLPIPPLDGGRVAVALLPQKQSLLLEKVEPFGFPILLVLMFTGALSWLISPMISGSLVILRRMFFI